VRVSVCECVYMICGCFCVKQVNSPSDSSFPGPPPRLNVDSPSQLLKGSSAEGKIAHHSATLMLN